MTKLFKTPQFLVFCRSSSSRVVQAFAAIFPADCCMHTHGLLLHTLGKPCILYFYLIQVAEPDEMQAPELEQNESVSSEIEQARVLTTVFERDPGKRGGSFKLIEM
ncbi:unnamed protein product [Urochloa humidicola]